MTKLSLPMITIVIPTYRRPKLLQRAIMSALNQTYQNVLVCVYDNASNDETPRVVSEISKKEPRVKYFCHKKNLGGIPNANYGILHVKTPFFSFLYDDDVLLPDFCRIAMNGFEKFPDTMFSAGSTIYMAANGIVKGISPPSGGMDGYFIPPHGLIECLKGKGPALTAILYRKEILEKIGAFDLNTRSGADSDFVLRIAAHYPIVVSSLPCAIYMIHDASYCASMKLESVWPGGLKIIRNFEDDEHIPPNVRHQAKMLLIKQFKNTLFSLWITTIKMKNFDEAYKVTRTLNEQFNQKKKAFFMYAVTKICEGFPITQYAIKIFIKTRKVLLRNKTNILQEKFGQYAKYLKDI